jgi:hypothetical protein
LNLRSYNVAIVSIVAQRGLITPEAACSAWQFLVFLGAIRAVMISRHLFTDLPGALFPVFVVTTKDFGCTANSLSSAMILIIRL